MLGTKLSLYLDTRLEASVTYGEQIFNKYFLLLSSYISTQQVLNP